MTIIFLLGIHELTNLNEFYYIFYLIVKSILNFVRIFSTSGSNKMLICYSFSEYVLREERFQKLVKI